MAAFKYPTFADRNAHSANAKAALVNRFRDRPGPSDPSTVARTAERLRIHQERLARQADRQRAKDEDLAREAEARRVQDEQECAAEAARQAQREVEAEQTQRARRERLAAAALNKADQKAARDARYAARKARQNR